MRTLFQIRNLTLSLFLAVVFIFLPPCIAKARTTPVLDVNPDTLRFYADFCGGDPIPDDTIPGNFMVANIGGGSMTWTGSAGEGWVGLSPVSGGDYDSVIAWIDWSRAPVIFTPPQPGDTILFETEIVIESPDAENSPQQIIVQLGYTCDPEEYQLLAYPSHFELTAPPDDTLAMHIFVVEAHNANIEFYLSNSSNWLILPVFFAPLFTPDSVEFMVSTIGLDPGVYYDTIIVSSSDNSDNWTAVPVRLNVSEDSYVLASNPESFNFTVPQGVPILGESLYVYEEHGYSINFWTHNEAYWLHVDTMAASPLYTPRLLIVDIYADTLLDPGVYTDTIFIYADDDSASPLLVPVSIIIEGGSPDYEVATSPTYYHLNLQPETTLDTSLYVYETHGYATWFHISYDASWLDIPGGTFNVTPADLDISINTASLAPGFYADTIFLFPDTDSYSFPPVAVPVYVQVQSEVAVVHAVPDFFHFYLAPGDSIYNASMYIYEESGDALAFAVSTVAGSGWIAFPFIPTSGVTPDSLHFSIFTDTLPPGTYGDSIVIFYPLDDIYGFDDVIVPVILTIQEDTLDYRLETSPTSFSFSLNESEVGYDSLFVYEASDQQIGFYYQTTGNWLVVNPFGMPPYVTPMSMPVIANAAGLEPGIYIDSIFIWSLPEDTLNIQTLAVPVVLTVPGAYTCGDANGDEVIDVGDAVYLVNFVFRHGAPPDPYAAADANCDGYVNVGDIVSIVAYTFRGGPAPGCPQ